MLRALVSFMVLALVVAGPARAVSGGCHHGEAPSSAQAADAATGAHACCHDHGQPAPSDGDHCKSDCSCGCQQLVQTSALVAPRLAVLMPNSPDVFVLRSAQAPLTRPFAPPLRPPRDA